MKALGKMYTYGGQGLSRPLGSQFALVENVRKLKHHLQRHLRIHGSGQYNLGLVCISILQAIRGLYDVPDSH